MSQPKQILPGDFQLKYVRLTTPSLKESIDITNLVNFIDVYESIYSPFLTLTVNVTDAISIAHILPLVGEETLEIDIRHSDDTTGLIAQNFYIYKMSDRLSVSDRSFVYSLHCISPGAVVDLNTKLSQSYTGKISDLIETEFIKRFFTDDKQIYSHPTQHNISYISNYWSPTKNINYMCNRAVSLDSGNASYMFFENKQMFVFAPLEYLVRQDAVMNYFYSINTKKLSLDIAYGIVHKLTVDTEFDYMDRMQNGTYGNTTLIVDSTNKTYTYQTYDFMQSFDKFSRLNKLPFNSDAVIRNTGSIFRHRLISENSWQNMPKEYSDQWFTQRLTELGSYNSQTIEIEVSGDLNILTGHVINLFVPITRIENIEYESGDFSKLIDRSLSGRYLISAIHHLFDRERHTMKLKLIKDSILELTN